MGLDEDDGRVRLLRADVPGLLYAGLAVQVLEQVEQGLLLALEEDCGVLHPLLDRALAQACRRERPAERVLGHIPREPVGLLREALEGTGRRMDGVVPRVRLCAEAQLLPLLEDGVPHGAGGSLLRIGGPDDLAPELFPGQRGRIPLDFEVLNARAWRRELRAHALVEAIDHVDAPHLRHVETSTELELVDTALGFATLLAQLERLNAQLAGSILRVED
mmetsp:Transcript_59557/g.158337  ORF Transcript_59557/g.158337 Transcript_59557/m.158337 type:complete len:219 (-) Transcript_59557:421-1077(-)